MHHLKKQTDRRPQARVPYIYTRESRSPIASRTSLWWQPTRPPNLLSNACSILKNYHSHHKIWVSRTGVSYTWGLNHSWIHGQTNQIGSLQGAKQTIRQKHSNLLAQRIARWWKVLKSLNRLSNCCSQQAPLERASWCLATNTVFTCEFKLNVEPSLIVAVKIVVACMEASVGKTLMQI